MVRIIVVPRFPDRLIAAKSQPLIAAFNNTVAPPRLFRQTTKTITHKYGDYADRKNGKVLQAHMLPSPENNSDTIAVAALKFDGNRILQRVKNDDSKLHVRLRKLGKSAR